MQEEKEQLQSLAVCVLASSYFFPTGLTTGLLDIPKFCGDCAHDFTRGENVVWLYYMYISEGRVLNKSLAKFTIY